MPNEPQTGHSRRWLSLAWRVARLWLRQPERTSDLVSRSYDAIAPGYDEAWTTHMRGLSLELLDRLAPERGARCLDLTCGTGFVTGELARRTETAAAGVDASAGMIATARRLRPGCAFFHADVLEHLRSLPRASVDVITCGWGLGYTRPFAVVRECARVLVPGGRLAVIDNSLFSLAEVIWASMLTFAERPEALRHVMRVRFLPGAWALSAAMRLCGLRVREAWGGEKAYEVTNGEQAIARLRATGAAAGFEFAAADADRDLIYRRFAELMDERAAGGPVRIVHRYVAAIGVRR